MKSTKKCFCLFTLVCLAILIYSGCTTQRYTTKFMATPLESVNEDLSIDPQKLSNELDQEMRIEDEKRRKKLLDKVKAETDKRNKPETQKTEEVK